MCEILSSNTIKHNYFELDIIEYKWKYFELDSQPAYLSLQVQVRKYGAVPVPSTYLLL